MPRKAKPRSQARNVRKRPSAKTLVKRGQALTRPQAVAEVKPVFFCPRPRVRRLTESALVEFRNKAPAYGGEFGDKLSALVDEVLTIRDREISLHERGVLAQLRSHLIGTGAPGAFVDVVDRVVEVLEQR